MRHKALALVALALVVLTSSAGVVGCGGGSDEGETTRVYMIDGYRSELGMRGHLTAQERTLTDPGLGRLVAELLRGPTVAERDERGFLTAFPSGVRVSTVAVEDGTARVRLSSDTAPRRWRDGVYATAQLVYTVTQLDEVTDVVMSVNGMRCCVYDMRQRPWMKPLTRRDFTNWQGAPIKS